jgi:hypothetical protein
VDNVDRIIVDDFPDVPESDQDVPQKAGQRPRAAGRRNPGLDVPFQNTGTPRDIGLEPDAGHYPDAAANPQPGNKYREKTQEILSKYMAAADDARRAKLVEELTLVAAMEFDSRQELRSQELKRLEEQLKKLRSLHDRRAKEKDEIVRDRVRHLLRDADGLGWGADRTATGFPSGQPLQQGPQRFWQGPQ